MRKTAASCPLNLVMLEEVKIIISHPNHQLWLQLEQRVGNAANDIHVDRCL